METLFLLMSPVLVNVFTQGIKQVQSIALSQNRILLVRTVVGVLSFVLVVLNSLLTGNDVDQSVIADFVDTTVGTVFVALTSHIIYKYFTKPKE